MKYSKIEQQYKALNHFLLDSNDKGFNSMNHEFFQEREQYKYETYKMANENLSVSKWNTEDIGTGKIRDFVVAAIEIKPNNLVQWIAKRGPKAVSHYNLKIVSEEKLYQVEESLYKLFLNDDTGIHFDNLTKLIGKRYDLLAYLCFIKNKRKFAPIAPKYFDIAFKKTGIEVKTSHKCSWSNYLEFLSSIKLVQNYLENKLEDEVYFLDAHSFLWTIGRREYESPNEESVEISLEELTLEPVIKKDKKTSTDKIFIDNIEVDFLEINKKKILKGLKSEELVHNQEKKKLLDSGHRELSNSVSLLPSKNPKIGYDIDSYEIDGTPMQIEVKSITNKRFYITRNELAKSKELENYYLYFVSDVFSVSPKVSFIKNPDLMDNELFELTPENYIVRIEYR